jgi:L-lactate dehydrogenase (cytochrome)
MANLPSLRLKTQRTPGLFTDVSLATRKMHCQRWLLKCHIRSAEKWGALAEKAPAISDLVGLCYQRIPRNAIEYFRGGAGEEISASRNRQAFKDVYLNPSCAVKFPSVDTSTTVLGKKVAMPIIAAPVGSQRSLWPEGEAVAAEAAGNAGLIYCLSTLTGTRMERVKEVATGPCWFQLYLVGGREVAERGISRAKAAGYEALILTVDTAVAGNRLGDKRNNSTQLIKEIDASSHSDASMVTKFFLGLYTARLRQALDYRTWKHLSWMIGFLADGQLMDFPNIELVPGTPMRYAPIGAQLQQSAVTWADLDWIKKAWGDRPLIIKGVHNIEDARLAEQHGAAAIVISNHGGRQVDGTPATLHMLQEIAPELKAGGSRMEVYLDGGVRTGQDVVVARACGARAVLVGQALAFAIGAGGPRGASRCFSIFKDELESTLRLLGKVKGSIEDVDDRIFYRFKHRIA